MLFRTPFFSDKNSSYRRIGNYCRLGYKTLLECLKVFFFGCQLLVAFFFQIAKISTCYKLRSKAVLRVTIQFMQTKAIDLLAYTAAILILLFQISIMG